MRHSARGRGRLVDARIAAAAVTAIVPSAAPLRTSGGRAAVSAVVARPQAVAAASGTNPRWLRSGVAQMTAATPTAAIVDRAIVAGEVGSAPRIRAPAATLTVAARLVHPRSRPVLADAIASAPFGCVSCSRRYAVAAHPTAAGRIAGVSSNRSPCAASDQTALRV